MENSYVSWKFNQRKTIFNKSGEFYFLGMFSRWVKIVHDHVFQENYSIDIVLSVSTSMIQVIPLSL